MSIVLFVLALALAALAWRGRHHDDRGRIARLVPGWLAGALALRGLIEAGEAGTLRGWTAPLAAAAALAGLFTWSRLASLAAIRPRRRDLFLRAPFAAAAFLVALAHGPWQALVVMVALATWSFRWRDSMTTRQLAATAAGLVAYVALMAPGWARPGPELAPPQDSAAHALASFARWASGVSQVHALLAIPPVLARFVSDPTLGIRTVRRRVALSHTLVVLVPLSITVGLWMLTTFLGAGADRALLGRRAVEAEAARLRSELAQALGQPGPSAPALAALAVARSGGWPGLRVWSLEGGRLARVAGDSAWSEAALPRWCAHLDSLNDEGVVQLSGRRWLGAAVRDSASGRAAVALVPIAEALAGSPSRIVGAKLWIRDVAIEVFDSTGTYRGLRVDSLAARADSAADSLALERVRRWTRAAGLPDASVSAESGRERRRGRMQLVTAKDTLDLADDGGTPGSGRASVRGVRFDPRGWTNDEFGLYVEVGFRETLAGLYRSAVENPFNFVPILVIYGLLLLLLPVAIFNQNVVRQLGRSVTEPVAGLRRATDALAGGRLDHRIEVKGDDELWDAARAFNRMAEGLEHAREREKEREKLEHELELARRIQARLLPAGPPAVAGLEIAGRSESAREVGGDYFDHLPLDAGRVLLVVADVSGKGVPAALLMSAFRAALMSQDVSSGDPAALASRLNDFLHRSVEPGRFVTAFVGFLDGRTGRLVYANAGHNPPALLRADGSVEWLSAGGLILGILPSSSFETGEAALRDGDLLALYTDGVTEGAGADGELYGEDRLVEALRRWRSEPCAGLAERLVREVRDFEGEQGPADDITLLLARRSRA